MTLDFHTAVIGTSVATHRGILAILVVALCLAWSEESSAQSNECPVRPPGSIIPYYADYKSSVFSVEDNFFFGKGDYEVKFKVPIDPKRMMVITPPAPGTDARKTYDMSWVKSENKNGFRFYTIIAGSTARKAGNYKSGDCEAVRFARELNMRYHYK